MSWFTVGEIALFLLIAVILGVILGWLLRGLRAGRDGGGSGDDATLRSRIAGLEAELARCRESTAVDAAPVVAAPVAKVPVTEVEPELAVSTDAVPEATISPAEAQARVAEIAVRTGGGDNASDELQRIHGIGPKIDGLLQSMGIVSFQQVARFTSADIADVTAALEVFPGRIERDGWLASARQLNIDTHGADPLA